METLAVSRPEMKLENSIFTIAPYRWMHGWVFDDPAVGLDKEAFVAGADTLLDKLAGDEDQLTVNFAAIPFPDHQVVLEVKERTEWGTTYFCEALGHEAWLCPALFKYFPVAPDKIYIRVKK